MRRREFIAFLDGVATWPLAARAQQSGVEAITTPVHDASELESVLAAQAREPNGGLVVIPDLFTRAHRAEITALASRYRLPAVYSLRSFAELGGLLSYASDQNDNCRRAASYADRILKGAYPSELPVQAPVTAVLGRLGPMGNLHETA
jgi:putative tryptophan/tyrosine transport system substrate-binding protein